MSRAFVVKTLVCEFQTNTGLTLNASRYDDGCIGFLPVYKTRAKAKKAWPTIGALEIETNPNKKNRA